MEVEQQLNLNKTPSYICVSTVSILYALIYFSMQSFVINYNHSIILFALGSLLTFCSYFVMDFYLNKYSSSYQAIPQKKKFYVLSNLIKSGLLLIYTPFAFQVLRVLYPLSSVLTVTELPGINDFSIFPTPQDTHQLPLITTIHNLGALYSIPDFVSMMLVYDMHLSTYIHHIAVVIFTFINFNQTYDKPTIWIAIVIYGLYSSFSYIVNFILASRFFKLSSDPKEQKWVSRLLTTIAFWIYLICCFFNWSWQIHFSITLVSNNYHQNLEMLIYSILLYAFIRDDIMLLKWLRFKNQVKLD